MSKLKGDPGYRPGWCIHYLPPQERKANRCGAGVNVDAVLIGPHETRPCFLTGKGESKTDAAHCDHLRRPTPAVRNY